MILMNKLFFVSLLGLSLYTHASEKEDHQKTFGKKKNMITPPHKTNSVASTSSQPKPLLQRSISAPAATGQQDANHKVIAALVEKLYVPDHGGILYRHYNFEGVLGKFEDDRRAALAKAQKKRSTNVSS